MRRPIVFFAAIMVTSPAIAQLRIVTMNATNYTAADAQPRPGMNTILSAIGSTVSDDPRLGGNSGIARPIDILCLQEVFTPATTLAGYAALLNQIHGVNTYSYGTLTGATTGNGTQGIVFNSATVQLLGEATIGTTNSSGMARQELRYRLRPAGYTSAAAEFYIYNGHWKSSAGDTARRLVEAQTIKADVASNLPANANVIYLGDMNVQSSMESGYAHMTAAGAGQAFDPINAPGNWNGNSSFRNIHTQSPWDSDLNPGFNGATGGMDDRFDQQIITANLNDGNGVAYISNSYFVLGNNGTHQLGQPLNTGTGAPAAVLNAESSILDHLPVSADYQLPAKMSVTQTIAVPAEVIVGGSAVAQFRVQNTAPVATANGADELSYAFAVTGAATGSLSSSAQATAAGNLHSVTFNTATTGNKAAAVNISSTSQAVQNGAASFNLATNVLAHAAPSLQSGSIVALRTIDFGIVGRGEMLDAVSVSLYNQIGGAFQASLDLDSITPAGDASVLGLALATGPGIAPGASRAGTASVDTAAVGQFAAVYSLATSDQDLSGAQSFSPLVLTLQARVALPGDATLDNTVNISDFALVASNFNLAGQTWQSGDFNHDGTTNIGDFSVLAANFNTTAASLPRGVVPEPGASLIALVLYPRRRQQRMPRTCQSRRPFEDVGPALEERHAVAP